MQISCKRGLFSKQLVASIKENPRLKAAADDLRKSGAKVGDAVQEALKSMEESEFMRGVCSPVASQWPRLYPSALQGVVGSLKGCG
jgi:hypothetical protein